MASPYLVGNFAPVEVECTSTDLEVVGALPPELDGRFIRNGPNPIGPQDHERYHWFTGAGMVHGLRLRDGRAEWYRNRHVRTPEVSAALGEEPIAHEYTGEGNVFAANTNVIGHAGRTFAIVEAGSPPIELTDELDTIGPTDFDGTLPQSFSAHPKRDPRTGELHVVAYYWGWGNQVQYLRVGTDGHINRVVDVPTTGSPMIHDMAFTDRYILVMDLPCAFDMEAAVGGASLPYRWHHDYPARVGLLPRDGEAGDTIWCEIDPCYVFHPMNAYDDADGNVVFDAVRHPKMFDKNVNGPDEGAPSLDRWVLDPTSGRSTQTTVSDRPQEFPRHNEDLIGLPYRFGYTTATARRLESNGLLKLDMSSGEVVEHATAGRHHLEPVFVPREGATAEDDGWILAYTYDESRDTSDVVVLDAQDFAAPPIATVTLPQRVPFGFHGNWVPTSG